MNVETALTSGLYLGRGACWMRRCRICRTRYGVWPTRLSSADQDELTLAPLRLRDQFNVQDATIVELMRKRRAAPQSTCAWSRRRRAILAALVPDNLAHAAHDQSGAPVIRRDRRRGRRRWPARPARKGAPGSGDRDDSGCVDHRTAARRALPADRAARSQALAHNAGRRAQRVPRVSVRSASGSGLRKMYIGTLTLALFGDFHRVMMLALALGNQLARPSSARGHEGSVAEGDYTPKREVNSRDELRLSHAVVQRDDPAVVRSARRRGEQPHRARALEGLSRKYSGQPDGGRVRVRPAIPLDDPANRGAERIFLRQPFSARR